MGQASRAMSKERLDYIASLLKNSITDEELEHLEYKKLLSLLREINDAEVIWLKNYSHRSRSYGSKEYTEFYETHKNILEPARVKFDDASRQKIAEKEAIQKNYKENLLRLNLLKENFKSIDKGKLPELDEKTGKMKASSVESSILGRLLLKFIDSSQQELNRYDIVL